VCEFHQSLLDRTGAEFPLIEEEYAWVAGYLVPLHLYFYRGHTWARVEHNGIVRVGIDDFAAKLIAKVDKVELPKIGEQICQGNPASELKQNEHKARIRSPMDGVVVAVNPSWTQEKHTLKEPYGKDWMFLLEPVNLKQDLTSLLYGYDAKAWMNADAERLFNLLQAKVGPLALKGAIITPQVWEKIPEAEWQAILKQFLLY
jgi:glycine cleavage system H lipoate-binding protein